MKKKVFGILILLLLILGVIFILNFEAMENVIGERGKIEESNAETYESTDGNYEYTVLEDGTVKISEYKGTNVEVIIPSTIDGYTVTCIGFEAFMNSEMTSVTIPSSVKNIYDKAFEYCKKLTDVNFEGERIIEYLC